MLLHKVTEKLLEAEKKKLTQLELQLDEDTGRGISSVDKVSAILHKNINAVIPIEFMEAAFNLNI